MVEFELVKILNYLGLEVGNLRGEEALGEYKRPPPPLISRIHSFILTFALCSHVAEILLVLFAKISFIAILSFFILES